MKSNTKEKETLADIIEAVANEICDHYCKYPYMDKYEGDEGYENMLSEVCDKCPLNRLQ